ncbi:phosphoribosylformylglycinamidine synthase subunit PurS [Pseudomonadota bacterium]|jgi:phosphoribosylformylglycinamidine synthase|nr:phosphoribosylformylglycinamidine synthase subunit PurS [Pseudomonadota bacterium]MDC1357514.1 phosphoribosylformylglycinamidine synthase subunit PurS [Pseudomonadota bacterium]|tara:strand:- start:217 stop:465 length:249 start_codon:yes stop_codon:yes gene_type:complete
MKVIVNISLKEGVLDPEGQAIDNTLRNLGFNNFNNIRTGKQIILNIDKVNDNEVLKEADKMCQELLVNTVIENYHINIIKDK